MNALSKIEQHNPIPIGSDGFACVEYSAPTAVSVSAQGTPLVGSHANFGEGNFKALFESIEEDPIRRGVLGA